MKWAAWIAGAAIAMSIATSSASAATVTVVGNEPDTPSNCYPFGFADNTPTARWTPYAAWFYKNVPAFALKPGDTLAFDLAAQNDRDVALEISLARTTTNGGTVQAQPFQTVVTNTQTPANPRGDAIAGNFELQFIAESSFTFPGGGLIIRFSNPAAAYVLDTSCDAVLGGSSSTDTSGFFVGRAYEDADGVSPWDTGDGNDVGAFRVITAEPPPPPPPNPDTDPPETTITKSAPNELEKSKFKFAFESSEPGSTFECKSDKKPFKPCTSPRKVKNLDEGKHKFKVVATDVAGNTDPSAAKDKFKVVEKP